MSGKEKIVSNAGFKTLVKTYMIVLNMQPFLA